MTVEHHISSFSCRCKVCNCKIYFRTSKVELRFNCAICGNRINVRLYPEYITPGLNPSKDPELEYRCDSRTPENYKKAVAKYYNTDIDSVTVQSNSGFSSTGQSQSASSIFKPESSLSTKAPKSVPPKKNLTFRTTSNVYQTQYNIKKKSSQDDTVYFELGRIHNDGQLTDFLARYPALTSDFSDDLDALASIKQIIKNVFLTKTPANYILSKYETPRGSVVNIRTTNSSYLTSKLGSKYQMILTGYPWSKSQFCVIDIDISVDSGLTQIERLYSFSVAYTIPENNNLTLQNIVDKLPSYDAVAKDSIQLWTDYFEWKQQLTNLKIRGVKYIAFRPVYSDDTDIGGVSFLCVVQDEAEAKAIENHFQRERENIVAYTNQVSSERWKFNYNQQNKTDRGLPLIFSYSNRGYFSDEDWDAYFRIAKNSTVDDEPKLRISSAQRKIRHLYSSTYYFELVFSFSSDIVEEIQFRNIHGNDLEEYLIKILFSSICYDGFLANSRVGDFALNNRLSHALEDLRAGKAASNNLGNWLFDITKARVQKNQPTNIVWSEWGRAHLNNSQKEIVKKALQSPDVFLCQGPPGTGKTTVIAEIVYQLTSQGKRVLIASQTNLAVNNALSKLIAYPNVRAIRLGSDRKMDESVEPIREQNILRTYFTGINNYVKEHYLNVWKAQDERIESLRQDFQYSTDLIEEGKKLLDNKYSISSKISQIDLSIRNFINNERSEQTKSLLQQQSGNYNAARLSLQTAHYSPLKAVYTRNDAQALLSDISPALHNLMQSGYQIVPTYFNFDDTLLNFTEAEINNILFDITKAAILLSNTVDQSNTSGQDRIAALNNELNQLLSSEDTDYSSFIRMKEIQAEIKLLKDGTNVSTYPLESIRLMLPDDVQEKLTRCEDDIIPMNISDIAQSVISKIIEFLERRVLAINMELDANPDQIGALRLQKEELNKALSEVDQKLSLNSKEIAALCSQYSVKEGSNLSSTIQKQLNSIVNTQQVSISRINFESFLSRFSQYVDSIGNNYDQENAVYLTSFINACNVVGVSCTESSSTLTENGFRTFDVAIIDEVSKATPPEILLPLLISRKAILVGDHRQLPPLFGEHFNSYQECLQELDSNDVAAKKLLTTSNYNKFEELVTNSLFKKHYERAAHSNKGALTIQYRMHHEIMDIVNLFYNGILQSGYSPEQENEIKKHYACIKDTAGYLDVISPNHHAYWVDTSDFNDHHVYEQTKGTSKFNPFEARTIVEIVKQIETAYEESGQTSVDVGIISFYAEQVRQIRSLIKQECNLKVVKCDVNTVDRFQGKEKSIVIVSLVRNVPVGSRYDASFVKDYRRINVAMSRAQALLLIVGAKEMYDSQDIVIEDMENGKELPPRKIYNNIIANLVMNGCFVRADSIVDIDYESDILGKR